MCRPLCVVVVTVVVWLPCHAGRYDPYNRVEILKERQTREVIAENARSEQVREIEKQKELKRARELLLTRGRLSSSVSSKHYKEQKKRRPKHLASRTVKEKGKKDFKEWNKSSLKHMSSEVVKYNPNDKNDTINMDYDYAHVKFRSWNRTKKRTKTDKTKTVITSKEAYDDLVRKVPSDEDEDEDTYDEDDDDDDDEDDSDDSDSGSTSDSDSDSDYEDISSDSDDYDNDGDEDGMQSKKRVEEELERLKEHRIKNKNQTKSKITKRETHYNSYTVDEYGMKSVKSRERLKKRKKCVKEKAKKEEKLKYKNKIKTNEYGIKSVESNHFLKKKIYGLEENFGKLRGGKAKRDDSNDINRIGTASVETNEIMKHVQKVKKLEDTTKFKSEKLNHVDGDNKHGDDDVATDISLTKFTKSMMQTVERFSEPVVKLEPTEITTAIELEPTKSHNKSSDANARHGVKPAEIWTATMLKQNEPNTIRAQTHYSRHTRPTKPSRRPRTHHPVDCSSNQILTKSSGSVLSTMGLSSEHSGYQSQFHIPRSTEHSRHSIQDARCDKCREQSAEYDYQGIMGLKTVFSRGKWL